ncbi:TerC/Alx family metal homeostasis membrane protein [Edaphobacter bradus]|uniref:TerC/Alx family metal homeostasis membrane protein n=1 Tax=Edaphobacter bradus TaxID=2259016 RepID=UPI0021DF5972|nr:TerC/Alx family metal homeostasis membrane protein [Edaphobacter bradus]
MEGFTPLSHWVGFHVFVIALMGVELLYARRQPAGRQHAVSVTSTALWVAAALAFAGFVLLKMGGAAATQYLAGYAIEEALSIDNLLVFLMLFGMLQIESAKQPKVLFWGVAGAIVMRGAFIAMGIELLERFAWISYVFGAVLLFAAVKFLLPKEKEKEHAPRWLLWLSQVRPVSLRQDCFVTVEDGQRMVTVLLLALVAIELTDLVFAIDSIPAVLSITRQPFLAYTSNIMAVMGLRSLYFLLAHLLKRLRFLHYGLAAVLAFAGLKMLAARWYEVGPVASLVTVLAMIGVTIVFSLWLKAPKSQVAQR